MRLHDDEVKVRVRRNIDGVEIIATRTGDVLTTMSREGWDDLVRAVFAIEGRTEVERLRDLLREAKPYVTHNGLRIRIAAALPDGWPAPREAYVEEGR